MAGHSGGLAENCSVLREMEIEAYVYCGRGGANAIKLRFTGVTDVSNWKTQTVHLLDRTTKILTAGGTDKIGA
jgi:hypothetical protein